jgi:hypothetical protein
MWAGFQQATGGKEADEWMVELRRCGDPSGDSFSRSGLNDPPSRTTFPLLTPPPGGDRVFTIMVRRDPRVALFYSQPFFRGGFRWGSFALFNRVSRRVGR